MGQVLAVDVEEATSDVAVRLRWPHGPAESRAAWKASRQGRQ